MTNRVLRECASSITESVTYLFNLSVSTGTFPSAWKNAIVIPIFKRRGRDSDPSNYRPVSLLPPLGKVLDAIQSEHLLSFLEKNDLLSKHLFGFLPHRSTVMQLIYVADTWMTALDRGKQPSAVFMDFKKAFDKVWHTGLLHKLAMIGVAPPSVFLRLLDEKNNFSSCWLYPVSSTHHLRRCTPRLASGTRPISGLHKRPSVTRPSANRAVCR